MRRLLTSSTYVIQWEKPPETAAEDAMLLTDFEAIT
jgi:hypothetical protein